MSWDATNKGDRMYHRRLTPAVATLALATVLSGCGDDVQADAGGDVAATVTVTETVTATVTAEPSPSPATSENLPSPEDFVIDLRTIEKKCFGSAGCNVTVSIDPTYVGTGSLPDAFKVTYEIRGGEDGPQVNTFSVEGDTVSYDGEERISTSSSDAELEAVATDVWS